MLCHGLPSHLRHREPIWRNPGLWLVNSAKLVLSLAVGKNIVEVNAAVLGRAVPRVASCRPGPEGSLTRHRQKNALAIRTSEYAASHSSDGLVFVSILRILLLMCVTLWTLLDWTIKHVVNGWDFFYFWFSYKSRNVIKHQVKPGKKGREARQRVSCLLVSLHLILEYSDRYL